jgi:hypothetical protein
MAADTVISELVLPSRAVRPFAFPFGNRLLANRDRLVTAIQASSRRGRRRRRLGPHGRSRPHRSIRVDACLKGVHDSGTTHLPRFEIVRLFFGRRFVEPQRRYPSTATASAGRAMPPSARTPDCDRVPLHATTIKIVVDHSETLLPMLSEDYRRTIHAGSARDHADRGSV